MNSQITMDEILILYAVFRNNFSNINIMCPHTNIPYPVRLFAYHGANVFHHFLQVVMVTPRHKEN